MNTLQSRLNESFTTNEGISNTKNKMEPADSKALVGMSTIEAKEYLEFQGYAPAFVNKTLMKMVNEGSVNMMQMD